MRDIHIKYLEDLHKKITFEKHQDREICQSPYKACYNGHIQCLKYLHETVKDKLDNIDVYTSCYHNHLDCLYYCLEKDCDLDKDTLFYLNRWRLKNGSLISNVLFRKVLLHPRIQNEITKNKVYNKADYPGLFIIIDEYKEYLIKCINILLNETNIPQDVIKYEILKYI